ncbi:MAG TPA: polysaccharide pyruvyl transferase family protein [Alphaproteobacteria bacterium]|jgi:pyruvyl transferase EpsO
MAMTTRMTASVVEDAPDQMERLARLVEGVTTLVPQSCPVVYLDYPVHLNVGDMLIEAGTDCFFDQFAYDVVDRRSVYDFGSWSRNRVTPETTLVLHGGGNFGDLYGLHQTFRENVVAAFPNNRIVMLPQTVHFDSPANLAKSAQALARHKNLHLCLRDVPSLEIVHRHFDNPAYLIPDMAHLLWRPLAPERAKAPGRNTLIFAREDKESRPLSVPGEEPARASVDWDHLVGFQEKAAFYTLIKLHQKRGTLGGRFSLHPAWRLFRNRLIAKGVRFLGGYDRIVTNRLHMGLLGLLLGRQVTMADNTYGKLSNYHSAWLSDLPDVRFFS